MSPLPKGWTTYKLGNIAERITKGATPTSYGFKYQNSGIRFIKVENIKNGRICHSSRMQFISEEANNNQKRSILEDGDILFSIAGTIGTTCLVTAHDLPSNTNQALAVIRGTKPAFDPHFLRYQLQWNAITEQTSDKARGGGMNNVSLEDVKNISLHIAPRNEQHRIATKLEKLLAKVDNCKERLDRIPTVIKRFRQSILHAACSGALTSDWRNRNPHIENVSIGGSRIGAAHTVSCQDIIYDTCDMGLPQSWEWVSLAKIGNMVGGGTPPKANAQYWHGSIPWVSPKDMKQDRISDTIDHITFEALCHSSVKVVHPGSILFVVRGMILNHTLPVAIVDKPVAINQDIKALVPTMSEMSEYLLIASKYLSRKILFAVKEATHGTRRLERSVLLNWPLPIPPIKEQEEIVRRVEALFKIADQVEARYQKAEAVVDKLTQSILAKAFRGELVPQDPNDEPASELLTRIREERAMRQSSRENGQNIRTRNLRRGKQKA